MTDALADPSLPWTHTRQAREHSSSVVECLTRDRGDAGQFEPHRRHCVVSLSKTHLSLLSTGSTDRNNRPDITEKVLSGT